MGRLGEWEDATTQDALFELVLLMCKPRFFCMGNNSGRADHPLEQHLSSVYSQFDGTDHPVNNRLWRTLESHNLNLRQVDKELSMEF
jgi:hypothetical protein